jgi:outer membrane protein OmpA-like peptidoglycan-associated protein
MVKCLCIAVLSFLFHSTVAQAQVIRDSFSIYFDFGKADIKPNDKKTLDSFAKKIPDGEVFYLTGYADKPGGDSLNLIISAKRAANVNNYLIGKHIAPSRIVGSAGVGAVQNGVPGSNAAYRRVTIVMDKPRSAMTKYSQMKVDETIELRNLYFGTGSHSLRNAGGSHWKVSKDLSSTKLDNIVYDSDEAGNTIEDIPELDTVAMYLLAYPKVKISIEGHVCCYEDSYEKVHGIPDLYDKEAKDYKLSENRAKAVVDYLVKKGVDPTRLSYKGYAFTRPKRYPENMPADMEQNRRVEMRIIGK